MTLTLTLTRTLALTRTLSLTLTLTRTRARALTLTLTLITRTRTPTQVQYVPFPVVAGFLGMVGSSILRSAFVVNAGRPMSHPSDLLAFAISQPFELAACVAPA